MLRLLRVLQVVLFILGAVSALVTVYLTDFVTNFRNFNTDWAIWLPVMAITSLAFACGLQIYLPRYEEQDKRVMRATRRYVTSDHKIITVTRSGIFK